MGHAIENELPFNLHGKRLAVLLELPSVSSAGRSVPNIDACIVSQLMRRFWNRISLEILGCAHNHQPPIRRSEEHTSELQSLMRISYAVFCLKKKNTIIH